ncbi:DUF1501 domain-containing protein [Akkermansiaceae bacterium]|nr:DUF1501 domain-containing protein [Akkermansiaceae bacterium]MDB4377450.1 DUF1501 domain-containing protein [Akkermansiaceae bacterium]
MSSHHQLDELSRRRFLANTAHTAFGVTLGGAASSWFNSAEAAELIAQSKGTAKNVIYLYMSGGMTHIDTFDPKPEASEDYRGPLKPIGTNVPGIMLGQHMTKTAKHADKMAIIRSMNSTQGAHAQGNYHIHTSYTARSSITHPSMGSWANKLDPSRLGGTLPPYVTVHAGNRHPGAGFFEPALAPLPIGDADSGLQNSKKRGNITEAAFNRQLALRAKLDGDFSNRFSKGQRNVRAYNEMFDSAVKLMKSKDLEAFDLSKESPEALALYGNDKFSKGVLLARRLVEHGVRFVEVNLGGFDWHSDNFTQADEKLPILDQAYAALMHDLEIKGLLDSTLVVIATEFGRTPKIDADAGRNHFPKAFSFVLAGAGIKGGTVYGETDETASNVISKKTTAADFNATIATAMGLTYNETIMSPSKRPFRMSGEKGEPIKEVLA